MKRLTLLLPLVALVAAGCGSGSDSGSSSSGPTGMSGGSYHIRMKGIQFVPKDATVKKGTVVVWENDDSVQHNAVADDGSFKSELFGKGGDYEWKATKVGKHSYVCTVHPGMKATLTVTG